MGKGQQNILKIDTHSASLFYKQRSDLTTSLGSQIFNGASLLLRACTVMILIPWYITLDFSVHKKVGIYFNARKFQKNNQ